MTADSYMAQYGARLADSGFPIIPIIPGTKAPGRYRNGAWQGYPDWPRHCDRPTKAFETSIWAGWPGAGIGVACGRIIALDIDVLDAAAVDRIEAMAKACLGDTPAIRIGQAPKRLLVYRAEKPFPSIKMHPLEILGRGAQFVAYADHPDTGRPYAWPYDSLVDLPLSMLPEITEDQARRFLEAAWPLVPENLRRKRLKAPRSAEHFYGAGSDLIGTSEAVAAALEWIPNDLDYDSWVDIGHAIKAAVGEDGLSLWISWSRTSSKCTAPPDRDSPEIKWPGFKPHSIGAGTIYQHAMDAGWMPPPGMTLNGAEAKRIAEIKEVCGDALPFQPMLDTMNGQAALQPVADDLQFVSDAPGLLGDMVRWMTRTAVSPQPFLALGASLAALGSLMGHRYRLDAPDTRSNVYILALADSGAGKDHPRRCVRRAFQQADLTEHLGGEQIKSGSGLMAAVTEQPRLVYQLDEFGHFVRAVLDEKSKAYHLREIMTNFTMLWSSSTERVRGAEYASRKDNPRRDIIEPCVSVYGSTVPRTFWDALSSSNVSDGSLARFLIFQSPENYPDEQHPAPIDEGLPEIVDWLKVIAAGLPQAGNLAGLTINPYVVTFDQGACDFDTKLRDKHLKLKRLYEGSPFSSIIARYREHVRRIALIAAVAANPIEPVCSEKHIAWAEKLVKHCQDIILDQAERFIADSQHEALSKRVLEIMRRHGKWMDGALLTDRLRFVPRKARQDLLIDLEEAGLIERAQEKTATKPRILWRAKVATRSTNFAEKHAPQGENL